MSSENRPAVRLVVTVWKAVTTVMFLAINLVFLAIVVAIVLALLPEGPPDVPKRAALVVAPGGRLVEQLSGDPVERAVNRLLGRQPSETLLKDVLDGIEAATDDDRIEAMLLDLDRFGGAGLSKLQEVRRAILGFKEAGKTVIAAADYYGQGQYHVASTADEIFVRRDGGVVIQGFGAYRRYYKEGLDRFGIDVNVFRVGEYKSYTEPYERDDMSPEAREANLDWLGDLWQAYLDDVAAGRGVEVEELAGIIENLDRRALEARGDLARVALDAGLVDTIGFEDHVRDRMIELVGEDEDAHSFNQIGLASYLEALEEDRFGASARGEQVGVVVARGEFLPGSQPPGLIGGDSLAGLIREVRHHDDVKALVLRIDSPGGFAMASENIRRELELLRGAGKPVVVSMSSVAASAGYHIAAESDEIWASPNTLTGSIGIFGMFLTFQRPLAEYLGVHTDGVGTSPWADAVRPDREMSERVRNIIQANVEFGYRQFVEDVARGRDMTPDEVDLIARGRVWSGRDALDNGLVDKLGTLDEAIASAAAMAELGEDYEVRYIEDELDFTDRLVIELLTVAPRFFTPAVSSTVSSPRSEWLQLLARQADVLAELVKPGGIYEYEFLEVD
jgi:protease-4